MRNIRELLPGYFQDRSHIEIRTHDINPRLGGPTYSCKVYIVFLDPLPLLFNRILSSRLTMGWHFHEVLEIP